MTLEEPHGNHVVGQRHNVVVELERVGVGDGDGEDGHVLVRHKTGINFRQMEESCGKNTMHVNVVTLCRTHYRDNLTLPPMHTLNRRNKSTYFPCRTFKPLNYM